MQYPMIAQPQYAFAPTMMAEGGLVAAARDVQSKGRNGDSMLVHMTPREVGGLQALAMQHGGSLSINPQTGLPEASFLKNLLPTLIGAGLMFVPGLQGVGAGYIGAGVGAAEALRTGDIGKGLLAGLGAFGGANLASGAMAAGAAGGAGASAAGGAGTAGLQFADAAGPEFLASQGVGTAGTQAAVNQSAAETARLAAANQAASGINPSVFGIDDLVVGGDSSRVLAGSGQVAPTFSSNAAQAGRGVGNLFTKEGAFKEFIGTPATKTAEATGLGGGFGAARTVGMAAAPALMAGPEYAPPSRTEEESNYEGPYTPSERRVSYPGLDERRRTSEYMYFTPSNPVPFDAGGKVEEDRSIKMPGADYVGGKSPEFSHGFRPIEVAINTGDASGFSPGSSPFATIGGKGNMIKKIMQTVSGKKGESNYEDLSGYEYDPRSQRLVRSSSSGGLPALAKGGSVPMLEDGGFVLTKKAVDGLGKGNNKRGQRVASAGLGAIPIKGAGAKRGPKAGVDDKIKTSIEGKRPALVSNGEAYVPKKQVAKRGGAKAFYALMDKAEKQAKKAKRA